MIIHSLLLLALLAEPQDITVHFFYTPDCGHCMDILLDEIPTMQTKYRFKLRKYDINSFEDYRLLERMEEKIPEEEKGDDLPIVFVGDSVLYGPAQVRERLEGTLRSLSTAAEPAVRDTGKTIIDSVVQKTSEVHLYYFYQTGCRECSRIDILLNLLQKEFDNLTVHKLNILIDSCKILFEGLAKKTEIPGQKRLLVPALIIGEDHLIKEEINLENIDALLKKYKEGSLAYDKSDFGSAEQDIYERFSHLSIFGILFAGLLDGVNPCAFATLIFFVSYLLFIGRRRRQVILMAVFFIIAVFTAYLAIGLGAYNLLEYLSGFVVIARIIFYGFGIIAFILGILSLRDYFMARRGDYGKMVLQLPLGIKQRIHKDIKEKTAAGSIILGSLIAGFLISFLEFGCTGQIYLPTITFMISKAGFSLKPVFALFLYNIMFVLPLIVIAVLATIFTTKKVGKFLETKIPTIKLLTALLFFCLAVLLVISA